MGRHVSLDAIHNVRVPEGAMKSHAAFDDHRTHAALCKALQRRLDGRISIDDEYFSAGPGQGCRSLGR